jgi:hypothetical protein
MQKVILLAAFIALVAGDCYMQWPRGSNDRLNEQNTDRNNANRLFDSQNNAQGGYCRGPAMSFYAGSQISVQWTNQHGCGRVMSVFCNFVIQFMCSMSDAPGNLLIRDGSGSTTNTITDTPEASFELDPAANSTGTPLVDQYLYGLHETYDYYQSCLGRDRNLGLFIADRETQGGLTTNQRSAIYTRQNNNGDRHGYECTEERDYYPYWGPSPWIDIAILTQDTAWCSFYQSQSQNVLARGYCQKPADDATNNQAVNNTYARYISQTQCTNAGYTWVTVPSWGMSQPDCVQAPYSRDNHLGNSFGGFESTYNWTIPSVVPTNWTTGTASTSDCVANSSCNCVLRLRYNISTSDGSSDSTSNPEEYANPVSGFADASKNGPSSPITQNPYSVVDGYSVKLAVDTTQFGRTFQDRSYMFHILALPTGIPSTARIHNLGVKGKRGNIVQAYPATEYIFTPEFATVTAGDYVHFQWTGCDDNPAGNAGEGADQTDRSNIMQVKAKSDSVPASNTWLSANPSSNLFPNADLRGYMTYQGQVNCDPNSGNNDNSDNNCFKLNAASQIFDSGLVVMNSTGIYNFMSSRNNDFSNRHQKGTLTVNSIIPMWAVGVVVAGAAVFLGASTIGALVLYAKSHPHSTASNLVSRL